MNTLQGGVFTLDVTRIETVQQLKSMLREKFPIDDPIEQKILKVEVLKDTCLLDDAQTLNEGGLHDESEVTVIYRRNEIEAATKDDVHTQEFCQVNIPQAVTRVSVEAFDNCHNLVKVTIPNSVRSIGHAAFAGCTSLKSIIIPDSVTRIGDCAFLNCTSLKHITIPDWVTQIRHSAFAGCTSLERITIPDWVTWIGGSAFEGCTSLENILVPDWVTEIGSSVFARCTSLRSITIGGFGDENWGTCL